MNCYEEKCILEHWNFNELKEVIQARTKDKEQCYTFFVH